MSAFMLVEGSGHEVDNLEGNAGFESYHVIPDGADGTVDPARDLGTPISPAQGFGQDMLDTPGGELSESRWRVINDQISGFIKELTTVRSDIRSIRVATHRGFQDLEVQLRKQCEDTMAAVQEELATRTSENQRLDERLNSLDRPSELMQQAISLGTERRFEALQEEINTLMLETDRKVAAFQEEVKEEARNREVSGTQFAQQLGELNEAIGKQAGLGALRDEAIEKQAELGALRATESLSTDVNEQIARLQKEFAALASSQVEMDKMSMSTSVNEQVAMLQQEQVAMSADVNEQVAMLQKELAALASSQAELGAPRATELKGGDSSEEPSGIVIADLQSLSQELSSERSERTQEMASMAHQVKDLRLCLEAEVGARSAGTERLHREVHDLQRFLDSEKGARTSGTKASNDSLHDVGQALQSRMQMLEGSFQDVKLLREELISRKDVDDKIQMLLDRQGQQSQSRGGNNLEVEVLREGLNTLEVQAKKHVGWVEAQADKHAGRFEVLETSLMQEAKARTSLDEELRQYLMDQLTEYSKFFSGELKGLLASAHNNWTEESRKLWSALDKQCQEGSAGANTAKKDLAEPDQPAPSAAAPPPSAAQPPLNSCRSPASGPPAATAPESRTRLDSSSASGLEAGAMGKNTPGTSFKSLPLNMPSIQRPAGNTMPPGRGSPRTGTRPISPLNSRPGANVGAGPSRSSPMPMFSGGREASGGREVATSASNLLFAGSSATAPVASGNDTANAWRQATPARDQEARRPGPIGMTSGQQATGPGDGNGQRRGLQGTAPADAAQGASRHSLAQSLIGRPGGSSSMAPIIAPGANAHEDLRPLTRGEEGQSSFSLKAPQLRSAEGGGGVTSKTI